MGGDYLFAYGQGGEKIFPMTFLDMIRMTDNFSLWIERRASRVFLKEAIENVLPDIHAIISGTHIPYEPHEHSIWKP